MVVDSAEEEDKVKQQLPPALPSPTPLIDESPLDATLSPPWSMVAIRNNLKHDIIFPPANHENLKVFFDLPSHIHIDDIEYSSSDSGLVSDSDSNTSSTFSPSDPDSPMFSTPKALPLLADMTIRFDSWTEILCFKVNLAVGFLWNKIACSRGLFLTFRSSASTVVLILAVLYYRQRRRLRVGEETRVRLTGIINEKEQKINQLLDQISRMNQVLLRLQRAPTTA